MAQDSLAVLDQVWPDGSVRPELGHGCGHVVSHASLRRAATCVQLGWTAVASVHLVGFSMGGMITQELVCADPERAPITTHTLPHFAMAQRSAGRSVAA